MNETTEKDTFDGMDSVQLTKHLIQVIYDYVSKNGVSSALVLMEKSIAERFKGRKIPQFVRGIFLLSIQVAAKQLFALPGHTLEVTYGIDRKGPWLAAICSSGSYALWRADSLKCHFHDWDREAVHYVR